MDIGGGGGLCAKDKDEANIISVAFVSSNWI